MKAIEALTVLDTLRRELHCQREKIACLEEAARYLSPAAGDGTGGSSGPSDRVGKMAGQIADEKAELERMKEEFAQAAEKALSVLNCLDNPLEREILAKRYIAGFSWEGIADKTGYSIGWIHKTKKSAYRNLYTKVHASNMEVHKSTFE